MIITGNTLNEFNLNVPIIAIQTNNTTGVVADIPTYLTLRPREIRV